MPENTSNTRNLEQELLTFRGLGIEIILKLIDELTERGLSVSDAATAANTFLTEFYMNTCNYSGLTHTHGFSEDATE